MNTPKDSTGGCCPPPLCSALAGTFDIEAIEQAFFNHDHDGSEPAPGQWEKRRDQWRNFKVYLAAHPRQEVTPESVSSTSPATEESSATPTIGHEADFVTKSTQLNHND